MAAPTGPTVRRIQLGYELKRLREKAGFTLAQAVEGLTFSPSKLHRTEGGATGLPKVQDLRDLLDRYGVHDEEDVNFLVEVHRDSLNRGWWSTYRSVLPSGMGMYIGLESGARSSRTWQPHVVFGLLQTERYAREMFLNAKPVDETTTEFVERHIEIRMGRKGALTRRESPLELWSILDEAALRRVVGSPEVMREQYEEIVNLTRSDNVTVQILPMSSATYRTGTDFSLLDLGASLPTIVEVDGHGGPTLSDKDTNIWSFTRRFDALRAGALAPSETPAFLQRLAREI
ncbi:helix-turn-helix domain-containing protein [Streptomyces sp. NPDC101062]|uniref:helix-turn-helix domain-containing protein n=1 Tax=unclassified Streptomyces TaxID=2593676 RepID=UPI003820A7E5